MSFSDRRSLVRFRWLPVLALVAVCSLPSRAIAADDTSTERDRVVAAMLESANLRMRAKIEESALLDRQGRHDEALVALRAIDGIHREAMAFLRQLTSPPTSPAAAAEVRRDPSRASAPIRIKPPTVPYEPERPLLDATPGIVDAAGYLASMQRADGWFRSNPSADSAPTADVDERHDIAATAFSILALVDSLDERVRSVRTENAISLGVEALMLAQEDSGAFGDGRDLEAHALASWAIAAGTSRLPQATWRAAARQELARAAEFTLARRDERGLWRAAGASRDDDWILSAFTAASLLELEALATSFSADVDLASAFVRAKSAARDAIASGTEGMGPAARFAQALLADDPSNDASASLPSIADGETSLLLGTTYRFGRSRAFPAWRDAVLAAEMGRQSAGGPLLGSWAPVDARAKASGRTYATAVRLLAALIPLVPFHEAKDD